MRRYRAPQNTGIEIEGTRFKGTSRVNPMKPWQEWIENGILCKNKVPLIEEKWSDAARQADGKRSLVRAVGMIAPGIISAGSFAVYIGELKRITVKTDNKSERVALHLFLFSTGSYVCKPEDFEPMDAQNGE